MKNAAAARGCPLDPRSLLDQVTVTASDGAVYRGSNAWIVVLWALVTLELGQTIFEEEVQRDVKVSGPARVQSP